MAFKIGLVVLALVALATSLPQRGGGGSLGGEKPQDPSDPKYYQLAQESLDQLVGSSGTEQKPKPIEIQKVVTQVVAGTITRIDFLASVTYCEVTSEGQESSSCAENVIQCHADVSERPWLNKKKIEITCVPVEA